MADPVVAGPVWDRFDVRLLPKKASPVYFKMLRPVAVLRASAKLWSRAIFLALNGTIHIVPLSIWGSGRPLMSRVPDHCATLTGKERRVGAQGKHVPGRCSRAYDAVRHLASLRSMVKHGVPYPLRWHIQGCSHEGWTTEPIRRVKTGLQRVVNALQMGIVGCLRTSF